MLTYERKNEDANGSCESEGQLESLEGSRNLKKHSFDEMKTMFFLFHLVKENMLDIGQICNL